MTVKFDIAVKAKAKHGILFRYMKEHNLTYNDMAALLGISTSTLSQIMHFRWLPRLSHPQSQDIIQKICLFFDCTFEEFLPPTVIEAIKNNKKIRQLLQEEIVYYKEPELEFLPDNELARIAYDSNIDDSIDQTTTIAKTLSKLTPREEKILRALYWEEKTLGETGEDFDISRTRVNQIQVKAIRKLRHPSRSRDLREFLPNHAIFYPCAICDRQHFLKREVKFLYIPEKLYKKNKAALSKYIAEKYSVCRKCAELFPRGTYTDDYTPPGKLDKILPSKRRTQKK